jgi:hypothetical protein
MDGAISNTAPSPSLPLHKFQQQDPMVRVITIERLDADAPKLSS